MSLRDVFILDGIWAIIISLNTVVQLVVGCLTSNQLEVSSNVEIEAKEEFLSKHVEGAAFGH